MLSETETLQRADVLFQQGRMEKAEKILKKLRKKFSTSVDVLQLSGLVAFHRKNLFLAINCFRKAIRLNSGSYELYSLLGTALMENKDFGLAEDAYSCALSINPQDPGLHNNVGNLLREIGDFEKAEKAYRESLSFRPNSEMVLLNLADILYKMEKFVKVEEIYKSLIAMGTNDTSVYSDLSNTLLHQNKCDEAIYICRSGISKLGDQVPLIHSLGHALGAGGDLDESKRKFLQILKINPDHKQTLAALSTHYFLEGDWLNGWIAYEARFREGGMPLRPFIQKMWEGEDLSGKTILVWGEQGVGDEIMYASILADLIKEDVTVLCETDERLVSLFQRSIPMSSFFSKKDPPIKELRSSLIDFQCPMGNLGRWLRYESKCFSIERAFLKPDQKKKQMLREKYEKHKMLIVGLTWHSANKETGPQKSLKLQDLKLLFDIPGVRFVDLQYGCTVDERASFFNKSGYKIFHDDSVDQLKSLDDFAAQVASMDLVISISGTTIHMAGALGVPAWAMLQVVPNCKWMLDRDDTPWYESVRLFRQTVAGDWIPVIRKIAKELKIYQKTLN